MSAKKKPGTRTVIAIGTQIARRRRNPARGASQLKDANVSLFSATQAKPSRSTDVEFAFDA